MRMYPSAAPIARLAMSATAPRRAPVLMGKSGLSRSVTNPRGMAPASRSPSNIEPQMMLRTPLAT